MPLASQDSHKPMHVLNMKHYHLAANGKTVLRNTPKLRGKAAVKAEKRRRQALRRSGVRVITLV